MARSFTLEDMRLAFKAGWHERNRSPGLKKRPKRSLDNVMMGALSGGRFLDFEYIPDRRTYHASIWANSAFAKAIATETRRAETGNTDSVEDEGAGPQDIAQNTPPESHP